MKHWRTYLLGLALVLVTAGAHSQSLNAKLWKAVDAGNSANITTLKGEGANLDGMRNGQTPLMFAVQSGNKALCEALLTAGANPNAVGHRGASPLMVAVEQERTELLKVLLNKQADANKQSTHWGPLHMALANGNKAAAEALLANGANPSLAMEGPGGLLPLPLAVRELPDLVPGLLKAGADPLKKNDRGETAIDVVAGDWNAGLAAFYQAIGTTIDVEMDLDAIKTRRPEMVGLLRDSGQN